jgi:hypothetical protein
LYFNNAANVGVGFTSAIALTGPYTLTAWVRRDSNSGADMVFAHTVNCKFGFSGASFFIRAFAGGSSENTLSAQGTLRTWSMITVTRDASDKVDIYLNNGSANRCFADVAQTGTLTLTRIGRDEATSWFHGCIDEARIYSRCLTSTEIANLYSGVEPATTNLQLHYKFDEGSGTSATDSSGSSNTGTITDATYSTDVFMKPRLAAS